jgi:hypothetical protein
VAASHIVGGEIELLHITGFRYRVNLIYYFDVVQNPTRNIRLEEPTVTIYIFRKSDNIKYDSVVLNWLDKTRVPYTQPSCSSGEIISDKIIYTTEIELSASRYGDPDGYYMVWARCCRNYTISNIWSQDPDRVDAKGAGQTFYLEFPSVVKNGQPFVNSSPKNFPALNDYACPTKPYYVDFAGVDDDGDSLAYTLVTPLTTESLTPLPPVPPGPYHLVEWLPGYDLTHIVNKAPASPSYPDLRISTAGFLRLTPRSQGLYVFAVKVEEYRGKIKIGEVRRDFQMLVTDCRLSAPPQVSGKALTAPVFTPTEVSVQFDNTVNDNDRCMMISVADVDATRATDNFEEVINLKIIPLNFKKDVSSLLPAVSSGIIHGNGTIEFRICFPACPFFEGGPYQIGVIAFDDACALPLTDTLRVNVDVEPPHNERAKFNPPDLVTATLNEGDEQSWPFEAHDAEGDEMIFFPLTQGFSMTASGMTAELTENAGGTLKGNLNWDAFCDIYDFTKRTSFNLKLLVDDVDQCDLNDPDTLTYHLNVILPPDNKPVVDTDLTSDPAEVVIDGIEKRIYDKWSFNVTGKDVVDNDLVTVKMVGDGFDPETYGMSMPKTSAVGSVSSVFNWDLQCGVFNLPERDSFNIAFLAIDSTGKCRVQYIDSLVVKVKVLPPTNAAPQLSILNLSPDVEFDGDTAVVWPGQKLQLQLNVTDTDVSPKDQLSINMIDLGGDDLPHGWEFESATGPSVLTALFSWPPDCSIFNGSIFEHDFYFDFQYTDDRCLTAVTDTVRVNVKVKDRESGTFLVEPSNVFTPNGDEFNEFFSMEYRDESGEYVNILPPDNCQGVFKTIKIYNRWGKTVFTSTDRNFRWYGLEESAGVYFYHVVFSNREFKGTVSLRD